MEIIRDKEANEIIIFTVYTFVAIYTLIKQSTMLKSFVYPFNKLLINESFSEVLTS